MTRIGGQALGKQTAIEFTNRAAEAVLKIMGNRMTSRLGLGIYLMILLSWCWPSNAAVPMPPCLEMTRCDEGVPYNLYATDQNARGLIPFAVEWPTAPVITSEAVVRSESELLTSLRVPGRRTIVPSGQTILLTSNHVLTGVTDVELVVENGALIDYRGNNYGIFWSSPNRVKLHGGGQLNINLAGDDHRDFLVDGLTFQGPYQNNQWRPHRLAVINSELHSRQYGFFLMGDPSGNATSDSIIIANTSIISGDGQSVFRVVHTTRRLVVVDNRVRSTAGTHSFRVHQDTRNVWVRNNQFEEGGVWWVAEFTGSEWGGNMYDFWFLDNQLYESLGNSRFMSFSLVSDRISDGYPRIQRLAAQGNRQFTSAGSHFGQGDTNRPSWQFDGNTFGSQTNPPVWQRR